jgi:hypothetical protein
MTKQVINLGITANDRTGDPLRTAFTKTNQNFTELYSALGDGNTTYAISAETATGGVNLRLTGSDSTTDNVKLAAGSNVTITRTDANTITIASTATGAADVGMFNFDANIIDIETGTDIYIETNEDGGIGESRLVLKPMDDGAENPTRLEGAFNIGIWSNTTDSETVNKWLFGLDGVLTLPDHGKIIFNSSNPEQYIEGTQGFNIHASDGVGIDVNGNGWSFGNDGTLTLPNNATISSTTIGFSYTAPSNGPGGYAVQTNSLTVGIPNPTWAADILANPSAYHLDFNGGPTGVAIDSISGPAGGTNVYTLTGTWDSNATGFPIIIASNDYAANVTEINSVNGLQISTSENTWTFDSNGQLTLPGAIRRDGSLYLNSSSDDKTSSVVVQGSQGRVFVRTIDGLAQNEWYFKEDGATEIPGNLTFPDGTIQTTAYTGETTISKFVAVNTSGVISGSDDGITWNEYSSNLNSIDRVAVGPNKIVYIADSSDGPDESLWYADTYDTEPTEVTSLSSRNFVEVKYFKSISKFIAVGNDGDGNSALYYSDDGIAWIGSSIDPTFLATFGSIGTNSFCDIAENELGFFIISNDKTLGGFFLADITDTMNGDNHVDLSNLPNDPEEVVWANSFYFSGWHLITDESQWTYNSESNPTAGTFDTDWITLDSVWESEIGIPGGGLVEWVAGEYAGMTVVMASTGDGQIVYWPTVPAGPYVSIPKPYTATITSWASSPNSYITYTGESHTNGEKFTVTGSSVAEYNGTFWLDGENQVYTESAMTTPLDTTGLDPFTGTATIIWSHGQYIDALHYNDGVFYAGNDNEEMFKSTNGGQSWTQVDQLGGGLGEGDGYLNDIDSYISSAGEITFSGVQIRGQAREGKYGLIKLVPNTGIEGHSFLDNGQFVQIYPTNNYDAPHIHIAAGVGAGSEGDLFLGDDNKYVQVNHDGTVSIRSYYSQNYNNYTWEFNNDGTTNFPYLLTDIHNGGEQWGQTLKFGNPGQQVIITGPTPDENTNAERIIIQGQKATGTGEGGDVYLWGGDSQFNGGDIKIYAGDADSGASGNGGYVNIDGGRGFNYGGNVSITGGYSPGGTGGTVSIMSGIGSTSADNGLVTVQVGSHYWQFNRVGGLTLPQGSQISETSGVSTDITVNGNKWAFGADGELSLPTNAYTEAVIKELDATALVLFAQSAGGNVKLLAGATTAPDAKQWLFNGTDGSLMFPDATVQTTAWTGSVSSLVNDTKTVSLGANGYITLANGAQLYDYGSGSANGYGITDAVNGTYIGYDPADTIGALHMDAYNGKNIRIRTTTLPSTYKDWLFESNGSLKLPAGGDVVDSTSVSQLAKRVEGSWTVTAGTNNYSFTVPMDGTYVMWVKGNIPNGIITWNATVSVSNTNVPAIGTQYAWNYTGGGTPISLTSIPNQIKGTAGTISTDATYAGTTSNRFDFGISNTSGASQTVYYGYTKI